jgi:hypothetical protein
MSTRLYKLPSVNDERLRLLAELERDAIIVLTACKLKLRQETREAWSALSMSDLRRCADRWHHTAVDVERKQVKEPESVREGLFR